MSDEQDAPDALHDEKYNSSTVMRAYAEGKKKERQRVLDEVRDLLDDIEPCDHPIEEYEEREGFWDECPQCGERVKAEIHSLFVEIRRRLDDLGQG